MTARAYLVLGPESSGTRLLTRILIAGGCHGDAGHQQRFDSGVLPEDLDPVVLRRSVPHAGWWLDMREDRALTELLDCRRVHAVVVARDWHAMQRSQITDHQHAPTLEVADDNIARAYTTIFGELELAAVPYTLVTYESLIGRPAAQRALLRRLGLKADGDLIEVHDGNAKHYGESTA